MPQAVYQNDVKTYVGDDTARGCIVYFDGMVMEVLAFRLVNRPGSSMTTTFYRPHDVHVIELADRVVNGELYEGHDERSGADRSKSYHSLWRAGVRYYQVWGKNHLGVWKAEGGVQKLGDPARARS